MVSDRFRGPGDDRWLHEHGRSSPLEKRRKPPPPPRSRSPVIGLLCPWWQLGGVETQHWPQTCCCWWEHWWNGSLILYFSPFLKSIEHPVRTNQIPRQIPEQSFYTKPFPGIVMGGILPFGCIFIQLFFILNSIWWDVSVICRKSDLQVEQCTMRA